MSICMTNVVKFIVLIALLFFLKVKKKIVDYFVSYLSKSEKETTLLIFNLPPLNK